MIGRTQHLYRLEGHKNLRLTPDGIKLADKGNIGIEPKGDGYYVVYGIFDNESQAIEWWESHFSKPKDLGINVSEEIETTEHLS